MPPVELGKVNQARGPSAVARQARGLSAAARQARGPSAAARQARGLKNVTIGHPLSRRAPKFF